MIPRRLTTLYLLLIALVSASMVFAGCVAEDDDGGDGGDTEVEVEEDEDEEPDSGANPTPHMMPKPYAATG